MNQQLENLKEQFKELGQKIWSKIQESPAYAQMQERYDDLSPSGQKLANAGAVFLAIFIIMLIPMLQYFDSQSTLSSYEEKRNLIRELFKTYRESSIAPDLSVPPNSMAMRGLIESALTRANLLPEQNLGVTDISPEGKLIPQSMVSGVVQVKLSKLNLKQVVDIGTSLTGISNSVKLKDMSITANREDTRYFDATYNLYSLNVPEVQVEAPPEPENKKSKKESDK